MTGVEPARPFGHWHLGPARLPFHHIRVKSACNPGVTYPVGPKTPGVPARGGTPLPKNRMKKGTGATRGPRLASLRGKGVISRSKPIRLLP